MTNAQDSRTTVPSRATAFWHRALAWLVAMAIVVLLYHETPLIIHHSAISWVLALVLGACSLVLNSILRATVASRLPMPHAWWGYVASVLVVAAVGGVAGLLIELVVRSPTLQQSLTSAAVVGLIGAMPMRTRGRS